MSPAGSTAISILQGADERPLARRTHAPIPVFGSISRMRSGNPVLSTWNRHVFCQPASQNSRCPILSGSLGDGRAAESTVATAARAGACRKLAAGRLGGCRKLAYGRLGVPGTGAGVSGISSQTVRLLLPGPRISVCRHCGAIVLLASRPIPRSSCRPSLRFP